MKYYERDLYQAFFNTLGQICDIFKLLLQGVLATSSKDSKAQLQVCFVTFDTFYGRFCLSVSWTNAPHVVSSE